MKTIFAPKAVIDKWLAALRSGEYRQGKNELHTPEGDTYCCLGVLEHCLTGATEEGLTLPSKQWLKDNDVKFLHYAQCGSEQMIEGCVPYLPKFGCTAWLANDTFDRSFAEIADAIEECAEYTDQSNEQA